MTEAIRQKDGAKAGAIIANQIAVTSGEERFFWLVLQISARLRYASTPRERMGHWPAVLALAAEAGDDPDRQKSAVSHAFVVLLDAERVGELARYCLRFRAGYELYRRDGWAHRYNRALIHSLHGRWERAYRGFSGSLKAFQQLPQAKLTAITGYLVGLYAERSICASRLGWLDRAEEDLKEALAIKVGTSDERTWLTYMAEAELALQKGACDRAKATLQAASVRLVSEGVGGYPRGLIRMELLAARIARRVGNRVSFEHFTSRALALATEHDLKLSEAEIRRLLTEAGD